MSFRQVLTAALLASMSASAEESRPYAQVLHDVASMVNDADAQQLASKHGLQLLNVLWEDTGRWQGSSVGPNISDVTIEVGEGQGAERRAELMPVLRFPNFQDKTADIRLDRFFLPVGNQKKDGKQQVVSLQQFLKDPARYMSLPSAGKIASGSLLAPRDTHALVSAQAAFLPIPQGGKATFYPVIFNYQSTEKNPAVLTLLVTRQGTSMTIVDNARDTVSGGASWGQRLFFNKEGDRAPLTAERLSDVMSHGVTQNGESPSSLGDDMNLLMLIQVPLKYRQREGSVLAMEMADAAPPSAAMGMALKRSAAPDMEVAVLGHGVAEGPYTELDGLTVERDPRFPVRVTVQFYQATSHANIGSENLAALAQQISKVYEKGDYVGSLVVPGPRDLRRPTQWDGAGPMPVTTSWWDFPGLLERWSKYGFRKSPGAGIR